MKNILILGAGFGGIRAALKLDKALKDNPDYRVVLVDKNSYQTYSPSLYEVASAYRGGKLHDSADEREFIEELAGSACFSLKDILEGTEIEFIQDEIVDIKADVSSVILSSGESLSYEHCIIALGSEVSHYDVEGADACCSSLKSLQSALDIRHAVEVLFRKSFQENKEMRFVTIGAGLSGFEVTAEMVKYVKHLREAAYNLDDSRTHFLLLDAADDILAGMPKSFRKSAKKRLKSLGVEVRTGAKIVSVEPHRVTLEDGEVIPANFVLWGGGVKGPGLFKRVSGLPLDKKDRIIVDNKLRVKGRENLFAIGDSVYFFDEETKREVPATAWAANQEGDHVAKNILKHIQGRQLSLFRPKFPGFVSAAGGKYGIAYIYGVTIKGYLAWLLKRMIDLKYILSIYPFLKGFKLWFKELDLWTRND